MHLERRLNELSALNRILDILNQRVDFADALQQALSELVALLRLSSGWVFLSDTEGGAKQGSLSLAAAVGLPPALSRRSCQALREGGCNCQWYFRQGELDVGVNIVDCSRLEAATGDKGGLELHASVPLLTDEGAVGILNLASPGREVFDAETLSFLTAVGRALGLAFRRARLQERQIKEREAVAILEERARLAREMHDSVAQLLFAADLSLEVAQASPAQRAASLEKSSELVRTALDELRGVIELLRPADISQGIRVALCRLAERVSGAVQVHTNVPEVLLPDAVAEALYRSAQEGVHNALKHGHPTTIWISLEKRPDDYRLRVEDDGKGLAAPLVKGLGLLSLEKRVVALGGTVTIDHRKPRGARLTLAIPRSAG
jgi:two-component system NarL family sensor kinase